MLLRYAYLISVFFCSSIFYSLVAQDSPAAQPVKVDTLQREEVSINGFFGYPLIYYTPETRLAFGAAGGYYFKIRDKETGQFTRLSTMQLMSDYTQNQQFDLWTFWNVFTRNENFRVKGDIRYRIFTDRFYGVGNDSPEENLERYRYRFFYTYHQVLKKITPAMFVGLNYQFTYLYDFDFEESPLLEASQLPGTQAGVSSGLGIVWMWDSRDYVASPQKGMFVEVVARFFKPIFGSDFNYTNYLVNFRKYWSLSPKAVLATQTKLIFHDGHPPFMYLAAVGGKDMLRAYAQNRFLDRNFAGTQVEYRQHLFGRFGVVAFAGIGDVFQNISDLEWGKSKYSFGGGVRIALIPKEKLNIRVDYGFGRKVNNLYIVVREAF